jgi:hypothetical protein
MEQFQLPRVHSSETLMEVVVRQLMTRGFTREGAEQLLKGAPVTASNDTIRTLRTQQDATGLSTEMQSKLQFHMDRRAKVYQTLTNLLKMQHDSAMAVIRNIK